MTHSLVRDWFDGTEENLHHSNFWIEACGRETSPIPPCCASQWRGYKGNFVSIPSTANRRKVSKISERTSFEWQNAKIEDKAMGLKEEFWWGLEGGVRLEWQSHLPPPAWVMGFRFPSQKQSHDCCIRSSYPASTWGFVMLLKEANKLVSAVANKRRSYVKYLDYTNSWHASIEEPYPLCFSVFFSTEK